MSMHQHFDQIQNLKFKPSDFMKARHPDQFSDSKESEMIFIPKEQFDYFLETITQRSQEKDFEVFCRKLTQQEICPNIIIQTGPTGGGDSKVDSETYPVSDDISLKWYEGVGRKAASERWAFAFSAKKAWKSKVKSDVKSINSTGRKYAQIFFMSNQAISDKKRAETEDALEKKYGVPVHILDKLWIIDKVYSNKRFDIATSALNITPQRSKTLVTGPGDTEKVTELEKVEHNIDNFSITLNIGYQFVEDCLYAAILSRELEKPKIEVYGRFDRAKRAAQEYSITIQLKKVIYQYAWTAYWWYEDFNYFNQLYSQLEALSIKSDNVWDLERLCTLWTLLQPAVEFRNLTSDESKINERFEALSRSLKLISDNKFMPNASLTAKSNLALLKLANAFRTGSSLTEAFSELKKILESAENLMDVPVEKITRIIEDLTDRLGEEDGFDKLFEKVIEISEKRLSNGEKGRLLIKNGSRKLRCEKYYDAIKLFGRATKHLLQYEHRDDLIMAQSCIALAYERIGLLWAARGCYAFAVNQVYKHFSEDGVMPIVISTLLNHLVWIEIKLGRVPYALTWLNHKNIIDSQILELNQDDDLKKENSLIDSILGILILKTRYDDLNNLDFLPSLLKRFGLCMSNLAALYALGYEAAVKYEFGERIDDLFEFFTLWLNQPANTEIPLWSEWYVNNRISLESSVLGLKFTIDLPNDSYLISLAEAILSSIEGFLATGISRRIYPATTLVRCVLEIDTSVDEITLKEEEDDCGEVTYLILLPNSNIHHQVKGNKNIDLMFSIIIKIIGKNLMNFTEIESMVTEDLAFDRMHQFLHFPNIVRNILGSEVRSSLMQWEGGAGPERFSLLRVKPWSDNLYHSNSRFNTGEPKKKKDSPIHLPLEKHSDFTFVSIINHRVWDKAGWNAVLVACLPGKPIRLILGIAFKRMEEALKIFKSWKKKIGNVDVNEIINISIITGINKKHPYHYKVLVCPDINFVDAESSKYFGCSAKVHTMTPDNSVNLDIFRKNLALGFGYYLAPATFDADTLKQTLADEEYWIKKNKINIVEAWKVKANDVEAMAITPDLDPIIPRNVNNVPVLATMQRSIIRDKK